MKLHLLIPVKPTVTVTESQDLQGWRSRDCYVIVTRRKALSQWSVREPFVSLPPSKPLLLIKPAPPFPPQALWSHSADIFPLPPPPFPHPFPPGTRWPPLKA